jgi:EamA domain-containing membrane protein RarD
MVSAFNIPGMSNRLGSVQPWKTRRFALYGALIGLVAGIVHGYLHAFWRETPEDDVLTHVRTWMVMFIVAGAALLSAVSAIRNWLIWRQTSSRP